MQRDYYLSQKKALEINPRHPLIKELLRRVEDNPEDASAKEMALMMFNTATLRSGYMLKGWIHLSSFSDLNSYFGPRIYNLNVGFICHNTTPTRVATILLCVE